MDSIPKDPILEYNDGTLKTLRKQYNFEKNDDMNAAIDSFEEWLKKQTHFTKKEYSKPYLERQIVLHKGSVERAKTHMDKLCTLRTLLPDFFEDVDVRTYCDARVNETFIQVFLPKMTPEYHRVYLAEVSNSNKLTSNIFKKIFVMNVIYSEYLKAHDYCDGFVVLVDLRKANIMDIVKQLNLVELRQIVTIAMEGFGLRVKGIHLLTSSTTIDMITKIMKQMFSAKIGNRIHVHRSIESLCEIVPKDILPSDFGGTQLPLRTIYEKWLDVLSMKDFKEYMKMMNQARTNETLRLNDTVRDQYLGIAGTFRTLSVD